MRKRCENDAETIGKRCDNDLRTTTIVTTCTILVYRCGIGCFGKPNRRTTKFATTADVPFAVGSFGQQQWKRKIVVGR